MKKIVNVLFSMLILIVLIGCSKDKEEFAIIDLTTASYSDIIEDAWENYLWEAYQNGTINVEDIDKVSIIGSYRYFSNLELDRTFYNDDYFYDLFLIISYNKSTKRPVQLYQFSLEDKFINQESVISVESELEELKNGESLDDFVEYNLGLFFIERQKTDYEAKDYVTLNSTYIFEVFESTFDYDQLLKKIPNEIRFTEEDSLIYMIINDYSAVLTGYEKGNIDENLSIPNEIEKYPVLKIRRNAFNDANIKSVVIPSSIKEIGDSAFIFSNLETITFEKESQLEKIGNQAFAFTSLERVEIPASVKEICGEAFSDIRRQEYSGIQKLEYVIFEDSSRLEKIGYSVFSDSAITNIEIPSSVKMISNRAFDNMEKLVNIEVKNNSNYFKSINGILYNKAATTLIKYPQGKTELSMELPTGIIKIDDFAFFRANIKTIQIPASVKEIGASAFSNSPLETITFSNESQLEKIEKDAFSYTSLERVEIPASVKEIGVSAFSGSLLKAIMFTNESQLEKIEDHAFSWTALKRVEIPASVKEIGFGAFSDSLLETIVFEEESSLVIIGGLAFSGTAISTIEIPDNVKNIGSSAFYKSTLNTINFGKNSQLEYIGVNAFSLTALTTITIPFSVIEIRSNAFADISSLNIIQARVKEEPEGWFSDWNSDNIPVQWGYSD